MKRIKRLLAGMAVLLCLPLCGCSMLAGDTAELLSPPELSGDIAPIAAAIGAISPESSGGLKSSAVSPASILHPQSGRQSSTAMPAKSRFIRFIYPPPFRRYSHTYLIISQAFIKIKKFL